MDLETLLKGVAKREGLEEDEVRGGAGGSRW